MKLKCDKHKRRVVLVNGKFIHRNGWGDVCDGTEATIGGESYTTRFGNLETIQRPPRSVQNTTKLDVHHISIGPHIKGPNCIDLETALHGVCTGCGMGRIEVQEN